MKIKRSISLLAVLFLLSGMIPAWVAPALAADDDSNTGIRHMELRMTNLVPIGVEKIDSTNYLVGNLYGITQLRLTPTLSDPRAKVEVDGVEVNDQGWTMIALEIGDNIYSIVVTAVDGTTKTYKLEIPRVIDSNADLRSLALSDGTVPVRDPSNHLIYSAEVHNSVDSITVTPVQSAGIATVTVNGTAVESGSPSGSIDLDVGPNPISIQVTAEDEVSQNTYTLTVTRAPITKHTVVFETDGGSAVPSLTDVVWDTTISKPDAPARSGYKFGGWVRYNDQGAVVPWNFDTDKVTRDLTLYARWTKTLTVTFDSQEGSPVASITDAVAGDLVGAPEEPTRSGYAFSHWFKNPSNRFDPWDFSSNRLASDLTLYAHWTANNDNKLDNLYLFKEDGSRVNLIFHSSGTSYHLDLRGVSTVLVHPIVFDNRKTIRLNGVEVAGGSETPIKLEKGYHEITITVTAIDGTTKTYALGYTGVPSDDYRLQELALSNGTAPVKESGDNYTANVANDVRSIKVTPKAEHPLATITVNGAEVGNGSESQEIDLKVGSNTIAIVVTAENGETKGDFTLTVIRAVSGTTYTVAFDPQGGSAAGSLTAVDEETTISEPEAPTRSGYAFAGWYKEAAYTTPWNFDTDTVTADTTLYAKWTEIPETYTVTFDSQEGSAVESLTDINEMTTISEPDAPTRDGYAFAGWYKEVSYATPWNFGTDTVTENTTLYAKWTKTYTIFFLTMGGSAVPRVTGVISGDVISEPAAPTRSGYTFGGWYDGEGFTTRWNFDTDTVTENIYLFAKWTAIPAATYTVTFNTQGGSAVESIVDVSEGTTIIAPAAPMRSGYTFAGWYKEADNTTPWSFDMDTVTESIILYAKWTSEVGELPKPVLAANGGDKSVSLIWNDIEGAVSYTIHLGTASGVYDALPIATLSESTTSCEITDLTNGTTYYFIVKAFNAEGIGTSSSEAVATPVSGNAHLDRLTITGASLALEPDVFTYQASVASGVGSVKVTPTAADSHATITVNGTSVTSGRESDSIELDVGDNLIKVEVLAQDGQTAQTYILTIVRAEAIAADHSGTPIPVTPGKAVSVTVPLGVTNANVTVTPVTVGDHKEATLSLLDVQAATSLGNVSFAIPEGTKITAPASWDGTIKLPVVQGTDSVSIPNARVDAVIKVGSSDVRLEFDRAVRILIPNQGGKSAGYVQNGVFKPITGTISADTQEAADREIASGGDAVLTVGSDLVIWTKHFTQFAAYTPVTSGPDNGGGSGGGSGGGGAVVDSVTIMAASGGTATLKGVSIKVPAGATASDIKITVDLVKDISILPQDSSLQLVSDVYEVKKDKESDFIKPVVITLPFDKSKVDHAKSVTAVYGLDDNTRTWVPLDNPSIDEKNGTVSGSVITFTTFAVLASNREKEEQPSTDEAGLADLKGHWSEADVRELVKLGAISGYPDNTFRPNANMTRAEFVTVIIKAFRLETQAGRIFADTDNHWAKDAISAAVAAGLVNGYSDSGFGPDDFITREQMALIVVRAAKMAEKTESGVSFTDSADISDWARTALATATANGLIKGYADGSIKPNAHASRAEAAAVILRALSQ